MILRGNVQWLGDKISVTFGSFLLDGDWPQLKVNKLYCGFDMTLWIQLVAGCHLYFNCSLDSLVSLCASKTNGLNPNRTWKQLTFPLSRILINNSLYCLPNNSYDASSDNLVLDQLIIPLKKHVFFVLSQAWDKEKILSPHEELNLRPLDSMLRCCILPPIYLTMYKHKKGNSKKRF